MYHNAERRYQLLDYVLTILKDLVLESVPTPLLCLLILSLVTATQVSSEQHTVKVRQAIQVPLVIAPSTAMRSMQP